MSRASFVSRGLVSKALVPFAVLALAACGGSETEPTYEADATDQSGGELIVTDASETGVAVDLPETPMTPAPAEESPAPAETPAAE